MVGTDPFTSVSVEAKPVLYWHSLSNSERWHCETFHYVTKGAESEQPVGAPFYQRVGCRDNAGIPCFPHSGSWQAQGGPAYICRDQRKHVFYNMGPLNNGKLIHFIFSRLCKWKKTPLVAVTSCYFTIFLHFSIQTTSELIRKIIRGWVHNENNH